MGNYDERFEYQALNPPLPQWVLTFLRPPPYSQAHAGRNRDTSSIDLKKRSASVSLAVVSASRAHMSRQDACDTAVRMTALHHNGAQAACLQMSRKAKDVLMNANPKSTTHIPQSHGPVTTVPGSDLGHRRNPN